MCDEYLEKYVTRMPGDSFGEFFLQYASDEFVAKVINNNQGTREMDKEEYAKFLQSYDVHTYPIYKRINRNWKIASPQLNNLTAIFTTIHICEENGIYSYVLVVTKQNYTFLENKIIHLVDKRTDYLDLDNPNELDYIQKYTYIPFEDITLKWHSSYHDGMLSGVAEYQNKLVWFECCDERFTRSYVNDDMWEEDIPGFNFYRRFLIYELSEDDIKHLTYWHNLFCQYVGRHTDYINNKRSKETSLASNTHHLFYDAYETVEPRNYCNGTPLGWFQQ